MELALVICLVVIIWMVLAKLGKKEKETERKERAEQIAHRKNLLHFYHMCKKAGISAIQTNKDLQNATQIASTMQLGDIDVEAFFLEASALVQKEREEKDAEARLKREIEQEAELEALRTEERQKCAELEKFSDCSGREKRPRRPRKIHPPEQLITPTTPTAPEREIPLRRVFVYLQKFRSMLYYTN